MRLLRLLIGLTMIGLPAAHEALASDFTGSWAYKGPAESGKWLLTEQHAQHIRFQLELQRGAPSYNSGWIEGEAQLHGNVAVFKRTIDGSLCEITFRFFDKKVELSQGGDEEGCEFGYNVFAEGPLPRTSHMKPKFTSSDPRFGNG